MSERALPNDEQILELIDLAFERLCATRVGELVSADAIIAGIDEATKPERVARFQQRFLVPGQKRVLTTLAASEITLGAWLPEDAKAAIEAALAEPKPLPKQLIDDVVTSEKIRDDVRALLSDTLNGFVQKAASVSDAATGGLLGKSPLGGFAAAGKSLLGGLGEGLQKQLEGRVREFVDGSVAAVQQKIGDKLASEETAKALGQHAARGFRRGLSRTEAEVAKLVEKARPERFEALVPGIVAHNVARAALRDAFRAELSAVLTELDTQTIGELLDEAGLRALVHQTLREKGLPIARALVNSPGFGALWNVG